MSHEARRKRKERRRVCVRSGQNRDVKGVLSQIHIRVQISLACRRLASRPPLLPCRDHWRVLRERDVCAFGKARRAHELKISRTWNLKAAYKQSRSLAHAEGPFQLPSALHDRQHADRRECSGIPRAGAAPSVSLPSSVCAQALE